MRVPNKNRVERTRAGGEWSEARFWQFVRSGLRLLSRRWPPRKQALLAARRPYTGTNPRAKWEHLCSLCGNWFMAKEVQVDHIEPCGQLKSFDDIGEFVRKLLVEKDGLRILCLKCHELRKNESAAASPRSEAA